MTSLLKWLFCFFLFPNIVIGSENASPTPNQKIAIQTLAKAIQFSRLYAHRYRIECLSFFPETNGAKHIIIAVHEKHSASCGGDPTTWPVVDRFQIAKPFHNLHEVAWIDASQGGTVPLQSFIKQRKQQER